MTRDIQRGMACHVTAWAIQIARQAFMLMRQGAQGVKTQKAQQDQLEP